MIREIGQLLRGTASRICASQHDDSSCGSGLVSAHHGKWDICERGRISFRQSGDVKASAVLRVNHAVILYRISAPEKPRSLA